MTYLLSEAVVCLLNPARATTPIIILRQYSLLFKLHHLSTVANTPNTKSFNDNSTILDTLHRPKPSQAPSCITSKLLPFPRTLHDK